MADTTHENSTPKSQHYQTPRNLVLVGIVAAAVSAATAVYIFWARSRHLTPPAETVQEILDRCHDQVRVIEERLSDLSNAAATS